MKTFLKLVCLAGCIALPATSAHAIGTNCWVNSASNGPDIVNQIDLVTGADLRTYNVSPGNGRGIVVVGNIVYSTQVGDGHIFKTDALTGASLGSIATAQTSMSTLAWDGAQFWMADYSGSNKAFRIDMTGNTTKTINLVNATGFSDGLEYFSGKLIANRTDGGYGGMIHYDVYDLDGGVLQSDFIQANNGTGIAFDGTDFLVNDVRNNLINTFDGTTGAYKSTVNLVGPHLAEDISVDYALRQDIVPEPGSMMFLGGGLLAGAIRKLRRKNKK